MRRFFIFISFLFLLTISLAGCGGPGDIAPTEKQENQQPPEGTPDNPPSTDNPPPSIDTDLDGTPDSTDTDDDNDNFSDEIEQTEGTDPLKKESFPLSLNYKQGNFPTTTSHPSDIVVDGEKIYISSDPSSFSPLEHALYIYESFSDRNPKVFGVSNKRTPSNPHSINEFKSVSGIHVEKNTLFMIDSFYATSYDLHVIPINSESSYRSQIIPLNGVKVAEDVFLDSKERVVILDVGGFSVIDPSTGDISNRVPFSGICDSVYKAKNGLIYLGCWDRISVYSPDLSTVLGERSLENLLGKPTLRQISAVTADEMGHIFFSVHMPRVGADLYYLNGLSGLAHRVNSIEEDLNDPVGIGLLNDYTVLVANGYSIPLPLGVTTYIPK